jgi:hypothetical protein
LAEAIKPSVVDPSYVDVLLIALDFVHLELVVPKTSDPELVLVPKRFREMASRLSIVGRSRCWVLEGVVGHELLLVLNLKTPS